jgi:hypothetical protein
MESGVEFVAADMCFRQASIARTNSGRTRVGAKVTLGGGEIRGM